MKKHLKQLDLKRIRITDSLFGEYVNKVSEKIIPHQWKILNDQLEDSEPTYCIRNFRIAAGEEKGERKGVVFQDTDLYKWLESVAYTIAGGRGENLEELADEVIDLIGKAQEPDGLPEHLFFHQCSYEEVDQPGGRPRTVHSRTYDRGSCCLLPGNWQGEIPEHCQKKCRSYMPGIWYR